ncbi:uncharacterized protein KRP23_3354 [Phytophthora ramorum]|uniref:RxLR effector protein n=1 Tax=Phytophthora ramorum TaxID=164328 RepID=H3GJT8_PHYRM|nr:hypothetical protein KRP23_3354 [Phytophthora ramorum]
MRLGYIVIATASAFVGNFGVKSASLTTEAESVLSSLSHGVLTNNKRPTFLRVHEPVDVEKANDKEGSTDEERTLPKLIKALSDKVVTEKATNTAAKLSRSKSFSAVNTVKDVSATEKEILSIVKTQNKALFNKIEGMKVTPESMSNTLNIPAKIKAMTPSQLAKDPDYLLWFYFEKYFKKHNRE